MEAWTKRSSFGGEILNCLKENFVISIQIALTFFQRPNSQWAIIGLGYVLAPNRQQAIPWAYGDPVYWCIYAYPVWIN